MPVRLRLRVQNRFVFNEAVFLCLGGKVLCDYSEIYLYLFGEKEFLGVIKHCSRDVGSGCVREIPDIKSLNNIEKMDDERIVMPADYRDILIASEKIKFSMPSDLQTGSLLRTLVGSKLNGVFLELGTGTGLSLSWILDGIDDGSRVVSIDNNEDYLSIAKKYFESDSRVAILCEDAYTWIRANQTEKFDLIFADAWPGKYETIDETLNLLKPGGLYIIDDMLPQSNWPVNHQENVDRLVGYLEKRTDLRLTKMNWSTGLIIVTKKNSV